MWICLNDRYTPTPDIFDSVDDFKAMCQEVFGQEPTLCQSPSKHVLLDEHGQVTLWFTHGELCSWETDCVIRKATLKEIVAWMREAIPGGVRPTEAYDNTLGYIR